MEPHENTGHPRTVGDPRRAGDQPARRRPRQHHPQRRPAHPRRPGARPRRQPGRAGVGHQLLHPGLRRPAVHLRRARRPRSAAGGSCSIGLVLFGLASLLSAYAQSPGQLIAARALMGIGGAAIMPATLSIISNVFDPRERGRAIGVWAGAVGLGRGDRPDPRRRAAGALLVGFGLPDQRAGRGGRRAAGRAAGARVPRPAARPGRRARRAALGRRPGRARPTASSTAASTASAGRWSGARSLGGLAVLAWFVAARAAQRPPVAGRPAVPGAAVRRARWRSSAWSSSPRWA